MAIARWLVVSGMLAVSSASYAAEIEGQVTRIVPRASELELGFVLDSAAEDDSCQPGTLIVVAFASAAQAKQGYAMAVASQLTSKLLRGSITWFGSDGTCYLLPSLSIAHN